jgi:hypothetical protein
VIVDASNRCIEYQGVIDRILAHIHHSRSADATEKNTWRGPLRVAVQE